MAVEPQLLQAAEAASRNIPRMVRTLLAARGRRAQELAEAVGLSEASLSERLRGKRQIPASEVAAFAAFLDVSVATLFVSPEEYFKAAVRPSPPSSAWFTEVDPNGEAA